MTISRLLGRVRPALTATALTALFLATARPPSVFAHDHAAMADTPPSALGNKEKLGTVHFKTSCNPAAQEQFESALAMLHSFYYPSSVKAFAAVAQADPTCSIAYWGLAISQRQNPLVGPFDQAALKAGLEATEKGLALKAKTEREKDWLLAIQHFYKDYEKIPQQKRTLAYEQAMEELTRKYPDDTEAAIFYALALNEAALPDDKTYAKELKAAGILEKIYVKQPEHPGIAHYLIHSYDYTPLAKRGLQFADKYARIAPAAPHAQHMPSHIYSMLGMWAPANVANQASLDVMTREAEKSWPGMTHPSAPHSWDFMEYAYLQMGQYKKAAQVRDAANGARKFPFERLTVYSALAAVPARFALERAAWKEAAALEPRPSKYPQAEAITWFTRALGEARGGNPSGVKANLEKLTELRSALQKAGETYWEGQVAIQIEAAGAWASQAEGNPTEALKRMTTAADLEDASVKHVAMENRLYPMRELLADLLLEQKQPKLALKEYEASLEAAPNRLRGLSGAERAANQVGESRKAARFHEKLAELTKDADTHVPN